jgi:hypothetical protein
MPLALMTHDRATAQNFAFSPKKPTLLKIQGFSIHMTSHLAEISGFARLRPIMAGIPTAIGAERACEDAEVRTGAQEMTGLPFCFLPRSDLHKSRFSRLVVFS